MKKRNVMNFASPKMSILPGQLYSADSSSESADRQNLNINIFSNLLKISYMQNSTLYNTVRSDVLISLYEIVSIIAYYILYKSTSRTLPSTRTTSLKISQLLARSCQQIVTICQHTISQQLATSLTGISQSLVNRPASTRARFLKVSKHVQQLVKPI